MKKILICAYSLEVGGIETSLINLINEFNLKYEITLMLQEKKGFMLEMLPSNVKIIEYKISNDKNIIIRKIKNRLKLIRFIKDNKGKYDLSICYATYDIPSALISASVCKNSIYWIHSNYLNIFNKEKIKFKEFFDSRKVLDFKKLVFVSNESKEDFVKVYPEFENRTCVINNIIDFKKIKKKSLDKMELINRKPSICFVGRLEEESKGILLLLEVAKELEKYDFWLVGDGKDKDIYTNYIKDYNIKNVKMYGAQENPYKFMKEADLVILTSIYEGFPVVCLEALVLEKKLITTVDLSANDFKLKDYAIITKRDKEMLKKEIVEFIERKNFLKIFDYEKFNLENINLTNSILENVDNEI